MAKVMTDQAYLTEHKTQKDGVDELYRRMFGG
jgi:hypothetical protein